ncbi:MAG: hypothetical protein JNN13_08470 [Planctomycetes bacterium]|nr:hypothetical protein [Planctomycetota bacterium]
MNCLRSVLRSSFAVVLLTTLPCCQHDQSKPQDPPATGGGGPGNASGAPAGAAEEARKLIELMQQQFKDEKIVVDAKAQTVSIPAVVNESRDPVEYLLIHRKGKRHEAVFFTMAKPSVLNTALLLVGLQPGKNAQVIEKSPLPTLEEVERGVDPVIVVPPKGEPFWMTVRWKGADGEVVEHCVEDLLYELSTQQPVRSVQWVYLGGRMARLYKNEPEVYVADFEGNLVSTCYMSPDNHLATMVHPNARDDQNWWTTNLLPAAGTEVEFVFHHNEPKLQVERRQRLQREDAAAPKPAAGAGDKPAGEAPPK